MPLAVAPFLAFFLGVGFAWIHGGKPEPRRPLWPLDRPTLAVALFAALVFAPVQAYFHWFFGDWTLAYLADSRAVPSAVELAIVLADATLVVAGFRVARRRVRDLRAIAWLAGLPAVAIVAATVALAARLAVEATYARYRNDFGVRSIAGGPLGLSLLWMDGLLVAGVVLTARDLSAPAPPPPEDPEIRGGEPRRRLGLHR